MGLSSITNRVSYVGDGSSTIFSFPYYFFSPSDLVVYLFDSGSSVIYPQVLNTNYTISGNQNLAGVYPSGGNVVMASSIPTTLELVVTRSPSLQQNFALNPNQAIPSQSLVQQLDYITALIQRMQDQVSRCIQLPDGLGPMNGSSFNPVLPQNIGLPSNAYSVLVLNSGASGFNFSLTVGTSVFNGILPVSNGGTGQANPLAASQLLYGLSATQQGSLPGAYAGLPLTSNGSSAPSFKPIILTSNSSIISGVLDVSRGGTGVGTSWVNQGLIVASSATQLTSFPLPSTDNLVLAYNSGVAQGLSWINAIVSPFTTKGDLVTTTTGSNTVRLGIGGDGAIFTANSGASTGQLWEGIVVADCVIGSSTISNSGVPINFNVVMTDTASAVTIGSSWTFTVPKHGYYQVNVSLPGMSNTTTTNLYLNGLPYGGSTAVSSWMAVQGNASNFSNSNGSRMLHCKVNDTIQIRVVAGPITFTSGSLNIMRLPGST